MVGLKILVDDVLAVSVGELRKNGLFVAGEIGELDLSKKSNWTNGSWDGFCFKTDIHNDGIGILYISAKDQHGSIVFEQQVYIRPLKLHYGGFRFWLECPCCGKNRDAIYLMGGSFACRVCHDLSYKSQNAIMPVRMLYKAQAIHQKLGGSGMVLYGPPEKPKGMHQKTYEKLVQEFDKNLAVYNQYLENQVAKIKCKIH